jgi:hypothetical protein
MVLYSLFANYLSNKSCKECHKTIYEEYQSSYHSKTYFNDELHRKVANKVSQKKYDCAVCHMPMADNIKEMEQGKALPDRYNQKQKDAISCFYCHQIAYVKKAHKYNLNILTKQANENIPTFYGGLKNIERNDKHHTLLNPIYKKNVCIGCHSHKKNDFGLTVFQAIDKDKQDSTKCIECHMPYEKGGVEDMNKKFRQKHRSHFFAGIHNKSMRSKSVGINISIKDKQLFITLQNKMPHPLIIQAARMKYLDIQILRKNNIIWKNFNKTPYEDKQGLFTIDFVLDNNKVTIPAFAKKYGFNNNLKGKETRILKYKIPKLKTDDTIVVQMYVILAKPDCSKLIQLEDKQLKEPILMLKKELKIK